MKRDKECKQIRAKINRFADGELNNKEEEFVRTHLNSCLECNELLLVQQKEVFLLGSLEDHALSESAKERLLSIPLRHKARSTAGKPIKRLAPAPAFAILLLSLISALFVGNSLFQIETDFNSNELVEYIDQNSFYTIWEGMNETN